MSFKTKLFLIPLGITLMMSLSIATVWWASGSLQPYMTKTWLSVVIYSVNVPFLIYNGLKVGRTFTGGICAILFLANQIHWHFLDTPGITPEEMGRRWLWLIPFCIVLNLVVYTIAWYKGSSRPDEEKLEL
jgi:hypothetical protein